MLNSKTVDEIHKGILANIDDSYDKSIGYLTHDVTKSFAIQEKALYDNIVEVYEKIDVEKLAGDELETFINQRKGITRKQATKSSGVLQVEGTGTIIQGAIFETEAGTQFAAAETKAIETSGSIKINAVLGGAVGNVGSNTIIKMPVTIQGINAVTNNQPTTGGFEAETDDSLLERYYLALRTPPTSGNKYHYLHWAKEVEGIGDAKVFPLERGTNTVEVVVIDAEMKPASTDLIQKVQEYIDPESKGIGEGEAPIGARCYVVTVAALDLTVAVELVLLPGYDKEQIVSMVEKAINNHVKEITFKQSYISYGRVGAIILGVEGVKDYGTLTLNSGTTNIEVGEKQVLVLQPLQTLAAAEENER